MAETKEAGFTPEQLLQIIHVIGARVVNVRRRIIDEGDRCIFGSTNDADMLRDAANLYDWFRFETGDLGPEDALTEAALAKATEAANGK